MHSRLGFRLELYPNSFFFNFSETYAEEMLNKLEAEIGVNTEIYTDVCCPVWVVKAAVCHG